MHSGGECLQGLRGKTMVLDDVRLVTPPHEGAVTISGPSFRYNAPPGESSDTFTLKVSGENRRQRGTSMIIVDVYAR